LYCEFEKFKAAQQPCSEPTPIRGVDRVAESEAPSADGSGEMLDGNFKKYMNHI
jgi:hypothetical protein